MLKNLMKFFATFLCLILIQQSIFAQEANWPRFRGVNGNGKPTADTNVPLEWDADKNIQWKVELPGLGSSSPIVWGDRVYLTAYSGYGDDSEGSAKNLIRHLLAIDRNTGKIIWTADAKSTHPNSEDPFHGFISEHGYSSSTPVTDGERIYCFYGKGGVIAYDLEGKQVWRKHVGTRHSRKRWGSASSPVLVDDLLIVKAGDEDRAIYAFDKETGEQQWKFENSALEQTYGTPTVYTTNSNRKDLIVAGTGKVWGMNPATGKVRWFSEIEITGNVSSSPVVGNDTVVIFGGYPRTMGSALKLGELKDDVSSTARLWENVKVKAYMTAPIFHNGLLYYIRDEGIACCADPVKGEVIYEQRLASASGRRGRGKPFYASPILVQDHIIAVSRTAGTFIIEAKPEYKMIRVNQIEGDAGRFQGTPAAVGNQLFLRSETTLYCISK